MNDLNSVLFEGVVDCLHANKTNCDFDVVSRRIFKDEKGFRHEQDTRVHVTTIGGLAESCKEYLTEGRGVRVVGRLGQLGGFPVLIFAEHIEFKALQPTTKA